MCSTSCRVKHLCRNALNSWLTQTCSCRWDMTRSCCRRCWKAALLQAMQLQPDDRVLEIGTGSGYLTACIAALSGSVLSIDLFPDFIDQAHKNLSAISYREQDLSERIELRQGDVFADFEPGERFSAVVVTGAVEQVPGHFVDWLADAARMFIIVGTSPNMQAQLLSRRGGGAVSSEGLLETDVPLLVRDRPPKPFQF